MDIFNEVVTKIKSIPSIISQEISTSPKSARKQTNVVQTQTTVHSSPKPSKIKTSSPFSSPSVRRKKREGRHSRKNSTDLRQQHSSPLITVTTTTTTTTITLTAPQNQLKQQFLVPPTIESIVNSPHKTRHRRRNSSSADTQHPDVNTTPKTKHKSLTRHKSSPTNSPSLRLHRPADEEKKKSRHKKTNSTSASSSSRHKKKQLSVDVDALQKGECILFPVSPAKTKKKSSKSVASCQTNGLPAKCGVSTVRGQVWLLRARATPDQLDARKKIVYSELVQAPLEHEIEDQIIKDLHRTFPHCELFTRQETQTMMFNILRSVALTKRDVGYCQGMGYVCGFLLTVLPEEDVFWMLCQLIDQYGMKELWRPGLPGLKKSFFVVERLVQCALPGLWQHFKENGLETSMWATPSLITVFLYNHSLPFAIRIWDLFLFEGFYLIYAVILAILTISEKDLLKMGFEELLPFLQFSGRAGGNEPNIDELLSLVNKIRDTVEASVKVFESEFEDQQAKAAVLSPNSEHQA